MLADVDDNGAELSLELCLGRPLIKPKRSEFEKSLVTDKVVDGCAETRGFRDGREMPILGVGNAVGLASEFYQPSCSAGCMRQMDDRIVFPQKFSSMSVTPVELPADGYGLRNSSVSSLRKSFSDAAGRLFNVHVDAQRKDAISQQHVLDQQRKKELHAQKRQAARKKRKLLTGEQKHQKVELEKSKHSPGSPTHSKSSLYAEKSVQYRKEGASKGLLETSSSETSLASQRDKIQEKHSILEEERAAFQDIRQAVRRERDRSVTDKELMFGSKPKANDEANLPTGYVSDHRSSQLTEERNKSETAQCIQKVYELRKMMGPNAPSITQKSIPFSEMASNSPSDAFQTDCRNLDQVDIFFKKATTFVDKAKKAIPARDKGPESEDPKLLIDQMSARNESTDSPTTRFEVEAPATPFLRSLPTNADSFNRTPFAFPLQNVGGCSHPVPNFMLASQALGSYGESPCSSYQFSIPPVSTPLQRATLDTTASSGTPVLQPTPLRHPPISRTKRRKDPGGATSLRNETPTLGIPSKPPLSGGICFEHLKGRSSFLDHAHSHAFSGTSSGFQEVVAASGPSHSGKSSSSSSEVYQSAHGETVESYPPRIASDMNVEAIQEHCKQTDTETRASETHTGLPSSGGLLVSTTANGKTIKGALQTYNEGEVKIRCDCHGNYMNAREFVVHAGGIADPHPERRILVINPFRFANP